MPIKNSTNFTLIDRPVRMAPPNQMWVSDFFGPTNKTKPKKKIDFGHMESDSLIGSYGFLYNIYCILLFYSHRITDQHFAVHIQISHILNIIDMYCVQYIAYVCTGYRSLVFIQTTHTIYLICHTKVIKSDSDKPVNDFFRFSVLIKLSISFFLLLKICRNLVFP